MSGQTTDQGESASRASTFSPKTGRLSDATEGVTEDLGATRDPGAVSPSGETPQEASRPEGASVTDGASQPGFEPGDEPVGTLPVGTFMQPGDTTWKGGMGQQEPALRGPVSRGVVPNQDQSQQDMDAESMLAYQNLEKSRKKRKRHRRIGIIVVVVIVALIALGLFLPGMLGTDDTGQAPQTAVVTRGAFVSTVSASGTVEPISTTAVTPEVSGIITDVRVSEGQTVNAGDVLFKLRNSELDRAVEEASAQVSSAQNSVDAAQVAYNSAVDQYNAAVTAWNSATSAEQQAAMTNPNVLWDQVQSADVSLSGAYIQLDSANNSYNAAVENANKRTVTAPCSGFVIAVNAKEGASYGAATGGTSVATGSLVQIADLSQMKVTMRVNEVDISKLAVGQQATVTFSALPDVTLDATVTNISIVSSSSETSDALASAATASSGGIVTYDVELVIPNPDPALKPGMTASAKIVTQEIPDSLIIPANAITTSDDGTTTVTVVTLDDQGAISSQEEREVTVLGKNSSDAAIEGLSAGDVVLVSGGSSATGA